MAASISAGICRTVRVYGVALRDFVTSLGMLFSTGGKPPYIFNWVHGIQSDAQSVLCIIIHIFEVFFLIHTFFLSQPLLHVVCIPVDPKTGKSGNDAPAVRSLSVTDTTSTVFICHFMADIVV